MNPLDKMTELKKRIDVCSKDDDMNLADKAPSNFVAEPSFGLAREVRFLVVHVQAKERTQKFGALRSLFRVVCCRERVSLFLLETSKSEVSQIWGEGGY